MQVGRAYCPKTRYGECMTGLWVLAAGVLLLVVRRARLGIPRRGFGRLREAYGFSEGAQRSLTGRVLDVEVTVYSERTGVPGAAIRTRFVAMVKTPGWSCVYHNKSLGLARVGNEMSTGRASLDARARFVPAPSHVERSLPTEAEAVLLSWFSKPPQFRPTNSVCWVRIGEGTVEVVAIGVGFSGARLEETLAEVVRFCRAFRGDPIGADALAQLRGSTLPKAKLLRDSHPTEER